MSDGTAHHGETTLKFDYNGLATLPYALHYTRVFDLYVGEALQVSDQVGWFGSRHLVVPPNVAAVIVLGRDPQPVVLYPGRHYLWTALRGRWPVSVQYVSLDAQSFAVEKLSAPTADHLHMEMDLWVTVRVIDPVAITRLREPLEDIRNTLRQRLTRRLRDQQHEDVVRTLPNDVEEDIAREVADEFRTHGLELKVGLTRMKPDERWEALQVRNALVDKTSLVERREAQKEEDVFALKQPAFRRNILGTLGAQARERNQQARMEAIETVKDLAKALVEDLRLHPGRVYTDKDMQPLLKALELLDKFAAPVPPPPIPQQVRSYFAVDLPENEGKRAPYPPRSDLPDEVPLPPGSVWDPTKPKQSGPA
jgi:hypothetical protein